MNLRVHGTIYNVVKNSDVSPKYKWRSSVTGQGYIATTRQERENLRQPKVNQTRPFPSSRIICNGPQDSESGFCKRSKAVERQ